ncbi:hypothetical protein [Curtobacterium poinsettiae]|uniref:hypothetical protein n=1 Tax=Curtobacterium poinsettiae TaxID=159612 RepID=UPI00217E040D|nr:hypothetical protein [Curtobacterium flaccumfaciens]MCS6579080.1 hypothetical protein [Curtobacterium flaccumfaciens]
MAATATALPAGEGDERRLNDLGLTTGAIHAALRPGLSRAANRTAMALPSSAGTDIYHDTMEQLALALSDEGWELVWVDRQPRLLHPDALIAFTLASGTNVAASDHRKSPRTRKKGKATRKSLAAPQVDVLSLFEDPNVEQAADLVSAAAQAPLWFLVHERTERGLNLEFSRPGRMTPAGAVVAWEERILIGFLDLDGDLSIFNNPDDGDFDVPVAPRS